MEKEPKNVKNYVENKLRRFIIRNNIDITQLDVGEVIKQFNIWLKEKNKETPELNYLIANNQSDEIKNILSSFLVQRRQKILRTKDETLISKSFANILIKNIDAAIDLSRVKNVVENLRKDGKFESNYFNEVERNRYGYKYIIKNKVIYTTVADLRQQAQEEGFKWYIITKLKSRKNRDGEKIDGYFYTKNKIVIHNFLRNTLVKKIRKMNQSLEIYKLFYNEYKNDSSIEFEDLIKLNPIFVKRYLNDDQSQEMAEAEL